MTIEITSPDVEALIEQRIRSGAFKTAEDVILDALRASEPDRWTGADLVRAFQASPWKEIELGSASVFSPVRDVEL